jgi:DNA-binding CsgD family transcriptional regulator
MLRFEHSERIAGVIEALGTSSFGMRFYRMFDEFLGIKQCTAFAFTQDVSPRPVLAEGCDERNCRVARELADEYVGGAFHRDENVRRTQKHAPQPKGNLQVFSFAASDFKDSVYRYKFYDEPELKGKLVVLASVGQIYYYINFYRGPSAQAFCSEDIVKVRGLSEIAVTALSRHRELSTNEGHVPFGGDGSVASERADSYNYMRDAFMGEGWGLTPREAEICAGILLGYSTIGLGLNLGISANTVATHRKHAYAKLGIGSQSELFARYLGNSNRRYAQRAELVRHSS